MFQENIIAGRPYSYREIMFQESIIRLTLLLKRNNVIRKYYCSLTLQESMKVFPILKETQCFKKVCIIAGWPYFCPAPWSSTLIPMTCNSATSQWKAVSTPRIKNIQHLWHQILVLYRLTPTSTSCTLQRQNTEISKQIFPEKEYWVSIPISTFMHLWAIYIFPWSVCLFWWRKYVDWSWDYINRSQTHECGNWGCGRAIPEKEYINGIIVAVYIVL
jgi:hypothetical protein